MELRTGRGVLRGATSVDVQLGVGKRRHTTIGPLTPGPSPAMGRGEKWRAARAGRGKRAMPPMVSRYYESPESLYAAQNMNPGKEATDETET